MVSPRLACPTPYSRPDKSNYLMRLTMEASLAQEGISPQRMYWASLPPRLVNVSTGWVGAML